MKFYKIFLSVSLWCLNIQLSSAQENNFISYDQVITGSRLSFKMVPIQGGTFLIGSAANEKGRNADQRSNNVAIVVLYNRQI